MTSGAKSLAHELAARCAASFIPLIIMSIQLNIPTRSTTPVVLQGHNPSGLASDALSFTAVKCIYSGKGRAEVHRGILTGGGLSESVDAVCKLVHDDVVPFLAHEAFIYEFKLKDLQGRVVPRFYGYFQGAVSLKQIGCLVLDYGGEPVGDSFHCFKGECRRVLYHNILIEHIP
ncbi:hypothetical protein OF83DRAFT_31148 [Amylostereum chailletii]|nr:hypothetical protein OF83DRAFT_31148 [Amylostereum chailletii]